MKRYILIFALLVVPKFALAEMFISEIMYDLDGTDSGREWIEVYNGSGLDIDLSSYFLYENSVAHKITFVSGDQLVKGDGFAVITSDSDKFLSDYPNFSGNLFDSVFALNNTGEELVLLDANKNELDLAFYNNELGANGNGNSLQLNNGVFIAALPTPGALNEIIPANENDMNEKEEHDDLAEENKSTHSGQNSLSNFQPITKTQTGIGRPRKVLVNTLVRFEVYTSDDQKGKYYWSFGDGYADRGQKVRHTYNFPGTYNVVLNAHFDEYRTTSRTQIVVEEPSLELKMTSGIIEIYNAGVMR